MPLDKLRAMPVEKILSFRRNPDPQQQLGQQTEDLEDVPRFLPSQLLKGEDAKGTNRRMGDSVPEEALRLPPPRRSPVSMRNLQRELYSPSQCMNVLKAIVVVATICVMFVTIPLYRRQQSNKETDLKMILLWNDPTLTGGPAHMECGCLITTQRNHNDKAFDAVVVNADHPYSLKALNVTNLNPDYYLVYAAKKPLSLQQGPTSVLPPFNLTMTYRLDSQVIWTDYYFSHPNLARRLGSFEAPSNNFADDMPDSQKLRLEIELKKKSQLATYMTYEVDESTLPQSLYLEEFRKYADLDAHHGCLGADGCSPYHFMLIFEPTSCPDYVPWDMYLAMEKYVVPVLIGGGNLTNLVPQHSYISSKDFSNPKDLISHLKAVAGNPEQYRSYFWWHSLYKLRQTIQPYCALCTLLQQPAEQRQILQGFSRLGLVNWWTEYQCPNRSTTFL